MALLKQALIILSYLVSLSKCDSLESIEHIVIFMQENRAFDHYYGAMKGVRGFNDRAAPLLPTGRTPFYQPVNGSFDDDAYMLPYYLSFNKTSATCMSAPTMAYYNDILMFDGGKMDAWNTARSPGFGMSYFNRTDLPFYYALGDNYLVGDNYYQSTFTPTIPNRLHLFSGSNGLSVNSSFDILDDSEPKGVDWITMGEILQNANITWRVYMEQDNFDDNGFAWFDQYRAAKPGNPLYDNGMYRSNNLTEEFANDVRNGNLTQVAWIVGPAALSEHARNHPQDGEDLSARLIKILGENEEMYKKTVFILNYDEGGQFYDHLWSPTAPMNQPTDGQSTVSTHGEVTLKTEFNIPPGNPIGPGFRVPFFIVSPWTRADGGIVFSQLTDHISTIKFIEKRFGVHNPNISPWRRAVMSDLLYAFDFDNPNYDFPDLPDTSQNTEQSAYQCDHNPAPKFPTTQFMPTQEAGTKISRALPYKFDIEDTVDDKSDILTLKMSNIGASDGPACVFHVHDYLNTSNIVKKFTIEVGKSITDTWDINKDGAYNISLHGPNGYVRGFSAAAAQDSGYNVHMTETDESVIFMVECGSGTCLNDLYIEDIAYGNPVQVEEQIMDNRIIKRDVSQSGNWYDYRVREVDDNGVIVMERRFMGRVETGKDTITDPAMAIPKIDENIGDHPDMKFYFDAFIENEKARRAKKADEFVCSDRKYIKNHGLVKDVCWLQEHK